jgi:hypothetical protein
LVLIRIAKCYPAHFHEPITAYADKLQFSPEGCWVVEDVEKGEDPIGYIIFYKWNIDSFGAPALSIPLKDQIPKNGNNQTESLDNIWLHDTALLPQYQGEGRIFIMQLLFLRNAVKVFRTGIR